MKFRILFASIVFLVSILVIRIPKLIIFAEPDCLGSATLSAADATFCITKIEEIKNQYLSAQTKNKKDLAGLQAQLSDLNKRISAMTLQLKNLEVSIAKREEDLAYTKEIFEEKTVNHYRFLRVYDPIAPFLADNAARAFREIIFRERAAEGDRAAIDGYAKEISQLNTDKESLTKAKESLASVQKEVSSKTSFLAGEVAKVDAYLATLSAKQQAFIAQKLEALGLSRSAYNMKGGCSSDISPFKSPGFSPAIAFFSLGVPNRVGLNQFGAKGRAESGQDYRTILQAYYSAEVTSGYNTGINIRVVGTNEFGQSFNDTWNIEDYVKHLYEMPADWPAQALQAQAIAARSYALSYTNNGSGSICPSQKCQVVKKEINNGNWQAAVDATRGVVLTNSGQPVKAWFSSTHGGYVYNSGDIGWSATAWTKRAVDSPSSIGSFSDLQNKAYDRSSSTFYCDWGSRSSYNGTAWLRADELADIGNVILLAKADGSSQQHLVQVDKPNPDGVDTWDAGRVKSELQSRGITPFDSVSDVSIGADFGSGKTTSVSLNGKSFDGQEFKNYFNLRAPSNIQIVGPLFNVEKR